MSIKKKNYTEKRQYPRRHCYCLIKYKPLHEEKTYVETLTSLRNISGNGLLFKSKELLPMDTMLEVKIGLPSFEEPIVVAAKVVRFEKIKRGKGYKMGITFINIKEEDRKKIIKFVAFMKGNTSG